MAILNFLTECFKIFSELFGEYQLRTSAAAQADRAYTLSQAEFNAIVSSVLTRRRLASSQDSQAAQAIETDADNSLNERKNQP